MDRIQLNNEVILMRQTIKRVKVQTVNRLTRQATALRRKKGNPEQLAKNKKRCERLIDDVQAIKDWQPDDITYAALGRACSLAKDKMIGTARERALQRLIHHNLFVKQFATFKDLVTTDLLQIKVHSKDKSSAEIVKQDGRLPKSLSSEEPPSPNGSDESDTSGDDSDGESFFLPSEQNKGIRSNSGHSYKGKSTEGPSSKNAQVSLGRSSIPSSKQEGRLSLDQPHMSSLRSMPVEDQVENEGISSTSEENGRSSDATSDSPANLEPRENSKEMKRTGPLVDQSTVSRKVPRKHIAGISAPKVSRGIVEMKDDEGLCYHSSSSDSEAAEDMDVTTKESEGMRRTHSSSNPQILGKRETKVTCIADIPGSSRLGQEEIGDSSGGSDTEEKPIGPLVDLPCLVNKKRKHIPGISAPPIKSSGVIEEVPPEKRIGRKQSKLKKPRLHQDKLKSQAKCQTSIKKLVDDQHLHPSWLARKAQKERETLAVSFTGKKTTFDDD